MVNVSSFTNGRYLLLARGTINGDGFLDPNLMCPPSSTLTSSTISSSSTSTGTTYSFSSDSSANTNTSEFLPYNPLDLIIWSIASISDIFVIGFVIILLERKIK